MFLKLDYDDYNDDDDDDDDDVLPSAVYSSQADTSVNFVFVFLKLEMKVTMRKIMMMAMRTVIIMKTMIMRSHPLCITPMQNPMETLSLCS